MLEELQDTELRYFINFKYFGLQLPIEFYLHILNVPGGFSTSEMYLPVSV